LGIHIYAKDNKAKSDEFGYNGHLMDLVEVVSSKVINLDVPE